MRSRLGTIALMTSLAAAGTAHAQNNHDHWGQAWVGSGTGLLLQSADGLAFMGTTQGNSIGILGWAAVTTGVAWGIDGLSDAPQGGGVYGWARAATGANYGVYGGTSSPQGTGVYGFAPYPGNAGYFNGNTVVAAPGSLFFGAATRQMLNLWSRTYGIGVQNDVLYFRADDAGKANGFAWYLGGKHSDAAYDPGGGTVLMTLDQGGLTVNGTFVSSSDAAMKQDVAPLDAQQVLEAVGRLPIREWRYKASPEVRHVGPMAQDFQAAFGVGADDKHIAMVDADGVALASIQALRQLVATQQTEIGELRARMAEQGSRIEELLAQRAH